MQAFPGPPGGARHLFFLWTLGFLFFLSILSFSFSSLFFPTFIPSFFITSFHLIFPSFSLLLSNSPRLFFDNLASISTFFSFFFSFFPQIISFFVFSIRFLRLPLIFSLSSHLSSSSYGLITHLFFLSLVFFCISIFHLPPLALVLLFLSLLTYFRLHFRESWRFLSSFLIPSFPTFYFPLFYSLSAFLFPLSSFKAFFKALLLLLSHLHLPLSSV